VAEKQGLSALQTAVGSCSLELVIQQRLIFHF